LIKSVKLTLTTRHPAQTREQMKKPVRLRECYPEPTRQAPQRRPPLSLLPRQDGTRRERNPRAWRPLDNRRRPSMGAAADGGGTSSTAANSTTSAPRQRGTAKRATTCREDLAILRSTQQLGQPVGQSMCGENLEAQVGCNRDSSKKSLATLNYLEIKQIMDRRSTQQKQGKLTDAEIKGLEKRLA